ncbi:BTAD domain-containing putative transcriptional regulator [Mycolicibacterium setense]|nr:BTAD domain-containing putative transcriptional regulator [Mycolicibacterium setense]
MELGVLGPLQVRQYGLPVAIPGAKPRAILTMLGLHSGSVVPADVLTELLWGDDPPRTAAKALQTHISSLRHALGDGFVLTEGTGWRLGSAQIDAPRYQSLAKSGRDALGAGDTNGAGARFDEAVILWRGTPELPDSRRGVSEKTRWIEGHAALVEDRAETLLATGRAAEIIGDLEAAVAEAPLRERRWGQLMLALYRAGRQGEALGAFKRAQSVLADELGVDPGPDLRRLESAIVGQDAELDVPATQHAPSVTRAVTFLLTDIEGSTAAWETDAAAMAVALARHDELVEQIVTSRGGRLIKTRGEGDATFSVFDRPSAAAAAAIELQDAIFHEPWTLAESMRIRISLHTGEAEQRGGDYFGRAVNRAARLRSQAAGGQILCSGATAELVIDSLSDDTALIDLGMRQLKNLARPEHVFELRLETEDRRPEPPRAETPIERPALPAVLTGPGPFVGRGPELGQLLSVWQTALIAGTRAVLIAGEPGVGKTRLAGEWSRQAYEQGAVVLYGRSDEDLGAPYQPFAEALRTLVPCVGINRLRGMRGAEALLPLVPGLTDVLPDLAAPPHGDADTERYALFDSVVALLGIASLEVPIVLVLDDLHWAAKPTLLLLRHLLRFGEHARVQIIGTYRSTDLDRSHPLAAMLADLHRDGSAHRIALGGLDQDDVSTYVAEAGYDDEELARALASVTGGNPFFLIEALRHVDESGGHWDPSTLPQGVREAVSRRLSRLPAETNKALAAAAVVGSQFPLELVERVVGSDLIDAFDEACQAGIVIEEPGGRYRFNHAIVRQSLLAELASVRRMRLHQRIATTLEAMPGADDELLAELAHHYFECAWAGNALKAVEYCRRAADQAMTRLAYEGAADLYDHALHALEELDDELPDRDDQRAELLVARCEALLAAGDVVSAAGAVSQLREATRDSARLTAWATCFEGQLSMLIDPEHLDEIESAVRAAAATLAELGDAAGEAKAHTVRASCLARLGRVGDCEVALDNALTAARQAGEHRLVNAVLAGAPLAALWGPNPVPRAGGRCLDVVRLLRITTDSPAVEATSTRCQAVLEAFRGRAAAARRMIDSARRTVTELGLRHALLEVEHFAGIVELVIDDPAAAELHLRLAYNGFRRMGIDADTAETAALLARACLLLDRDVEADELCSESERLAGHALKASITWRTVRAQLLSRGGDHDGARRVAEEAAALAGRTDALVDHGDACLALATVLGAGGDSAGARAAAERAAELYERKGAAALAERARDLLSKRVLTNAPAQLDLPIDEPQNTCVRTLAQLHSAVDRESWDELEHLLASDISMWSRRKVVGFSRVTLRPEEWTREAKRLHEVGFVRHHHVVVAVRGERLALTRTRVNTADATAGAPRDELLQLIGLDTDGRIAMDVYFDIDDMDAALAELDAAHSRLEEQRHQACRLENAATRAIERFLAYLADREWTAMAEMYAEDISSEDRRRVVSAEVIRGRETNIANWRAIVEIDADNLTSTTIATRGNRLALSRMHSAAFQIDVLNLLEVDADDRVTAVVVFDLDDIDAAFAELDARYLAGEAAAHAQTWSVIANTYAEFNRNDYASVVNVDHRRAVRYAPGELTTANMKGLMPNLRAYIEVVHRLTDLGVVVTGMSFGISEEGFEAEWRAVLLLTVDGDLLAWNELFDETDLDVAVARFDELNRHAPRLENTTSLAHDRFLAYFATRDWASMAEIIADDAYTDDRRQVVNSGVQRGRDAVLAEISALADIGGQITTSDVIATRGEQLALRHTQYSGSDERAAYNVGGFEVLETDTDGLLLARVAFDLNEIDAAFGELNARYLTGEASPYAHTWSVVAAAYDAFNRREIAATTSDWVNVDHRRATAFQPGDMVRYIQAGWEDSPDTKIHIAAVHRLSDLGAVVTHFAHGSSQEGFDAEWRDIHLVLVDGEIPCHSELFEEADLHAALARFDELNQSVPRLENSATRAFGRFESSFASRDWDAIANAATDNLSIDDRRRIVNVGIRYGRETAVGDLQATADIGFALSTSGVTATRGERLALVRVRGSGTGPEAIQNDVLNVVEVDADGRTVAVVVFDPDDLDAAFEELDARYLAGEASERSHTWSCLLHGYVVANRQELPGMTPDWVSIDHRRARAFAPGEMPAYMEATWDLVPGVRVYVEAVHRLSSLGAVVTHFAKGPSRQGLEAEWREVALLTLGGDQIDRCELFDESDLDAALARFDELSRPVLQLDNVATRTYERFHKCLAEADLDAMAHMLSDDICSEDRRHIVSSGIRHGRDAALEDARVIAGLGGGNKATTVLATRGEHLALRHTQYAIGQEQTDAYQVTLLEVVVVNTDERISTVVTFDADDFDSAYKELDARYLADEAAAYASTWSVIVQGYAALDRHEKPSVTASFVNVDHRAGVAFPAGDLFPYILAAWDASPDLKGHIEATHRLNKLGAVVTHVAYGSSHEGFDAEWRQLMLLMVDGDAVSRCEMYDEADLDAALARFDELSQQPPP